MYNIIFPKFTDQRYWDLHFKYILNLFLYLKCNITYQERSEFIITVNNKDFLIDYSDSSNERNLNIPTFKFHCQKESGQIFAFPTVSFYNWENYYKLEKEINYNIKTDLISNRQTPYGNAQNRRLEIQKLLKNTYSKLVLLSKIEQEDYWKEINKIKIAVFVPGYSNNMIDRGQLQYFAFGCCTISPNLPDILPFNNKIIDGKHYIKCKDDYSDLISIINNLKIEDSLEIGRNAKSLFKNACIPEKIDQWIKSKL